MKNIVKILKVNKLKLFIISIAYLASCSTTHYTTVYDDVYYNKKDATTQPQTQVLNQPAVVSNNTNDDEYSIAAKVNNSDSITSEPGSIERYSNNNIIDNSQNDQYQDNSAQGSGGNTNITNNYYDYEYASRIRRFHNPGWGYNYYDDYYTNSYWYNNDPFYWGTSIYMGYNWMYPSYCYYRPSWYFGIGFGLGWGSFGWGYPHYGWGSFYSPYAYGWGAYNPYSWGDYGYYYYNSYDKGNTTAYHYGGRAPSGGSTNHRSTAKGNNNSDNNMSFGQKYQSYIASTTPDLKPEAVNSGTNLNNNPGIQNINKGMVGNEMPKTNVNPRVEKFDNPSVKNNIVSDKQIMKYDNQPAQNNPQPVKQFKAENNYQQYSKPSAKYNSPANSNVYSMPEKKYAKPVYSGPKSYTSPSYSQPKSGQYYSKQGAIAIPGGSIDNNQGYKNAPARSFNRDAQKSYSSPAQQQPSYSSPATAPSRSYSSPAPSRSYNTPAQQQPSYSAPAAAPSRSYSAPSAPSYSSPAPSNSNSGGSRSPSPSGGNSRPRR